MRRLIKTEVRRKWLMRTGGGDEEVDNGSSRAEETAMATEASITETY